MAYIDPAVIEEIRLRNDIEQVISGYVRLRRAGSNLQGLCPFHSEKTPSFTVFTSDQSFYCFGCGAGGDVISFVRRAENLDYPSAVEFLAKRVGITVTRSREDKIDADRRAHTLEMNKIAAKFYHTTLFSPQGAPGLDYLHRRGLTDVQIRHFGLGFAPDGFSALTGLLSSKGYTDSEMSDAFLCGISRKNGKPYDYFRNRVMFPIISPAGEVLAFGGRVMDDSEPKYLNSSDTPAFKKSRNLFALNFARAECSEELILCEGYMDVIALHGAGFVNSVATLGTAITPEQARLIKRCTKKVFICYDSDAAGQRAAYKAFRLLGETGVDCRIIKVENAKDPDEFIKKFGSEAFRTSVLGKSRSEFEFRLDNILSENDIGTLDGKVKATGLITSMIATFPGSAQREVYIKSASDILDIPQDSLRRDVNNTIKRGENAREQEEFRKIANAAGGYGDKVNPDAVKNPKAAKAEEAALGILLLHPEYIGELRSAGKLPPEDSFVTEFGKRVYTAILSHCEGALSLISVLGQEFSVEEMDRIEKMRMDRAKVANNTPALLEDCFASLDEAARRSGMDIDDILNKKRNKKSKNT